MSTSDAGGSSGNGPNSANGSGIPSDGTSVEQLVNEAVNKAIGARMKRLDLGSQIEAAVQAALSKVAPVVEGQNKPEPAHEGGTEKLSSVRALQEKYDNEMKAMRATVEGERTARVAAEQRAKDTSARAELRSKLAAKMGADHPMLGTVMDSLYDAKKRVVESDGRLAIKFPGQYGEDELKPLDEGIDALFTGEFKSLVQQSKAGNLPPGSVVRGQQVQAGQRSPSRNPIYDEIASDLSTSRPDIAALLNSNSQK
jgi:hypothetical protein